MAEGEVGGKVCRACARFFALDDFNRSAEHLFGRAPLCRPCQRTKKNAIRAAWTKEQWAAHYAASQAWLKAHPETSRQAKARWNAANPDKVRKHSREAAARLRRRKPELVRLRRLASMAKKPAHYKRLKAIHDRLRYSRKKAASHCVVTRHDLERLFARFDGRCFYCSSPATDVDHVIPLARGGRHAIGNFVPSCRSCNDSKGAKYLIEWRWYLTKRLQQVA